MVSKRGAVQVDRTLLVMNNNSGIERLGRGTDGCPEPLAFWDFQEAAGEARVSRMGHPFRLHEGGGTVARADEGVFGPHAAVFGDGSWLELPRSECGALNIHGTEAQMTLIAWIKRRQSAYGGCQAVAGMWNEHERRQYCLFLNLGIWDSAEQVGAHVSAIGGATPGYKYCMDAAIGGTVVPFDEWQCVAITYDGQCARAYLNGRLDEREGRNPYPYPYGLFDGGEGGADFTVGAVARPDWVDEQFVPHGSSIANPFVGLLAGLAVFDRALTDDELKAVCG